MNFKKFLGRICWNIYVIPLSTNEQITLAYFTKWKYPKTYFIITCILLYLKSNKIIKCNGLLLFYLMSDDDVRKIGVDHSR